VKFLLDTDHVSLLLANDQRVMWNLLCHSADDCAISVITVEEELVGWLTDLNRARDQVKRERISRKMAHTIMGLAGWTILPFTLAAMNRYDGLLRMKLNVGSNDLRIAAIAICRGAIVVTRNRRDFSRVPGLAIVDWTL